MLLDSVSHAKDDVAQRMIIEARTEGEQMVYTVERFLNSNGQLLNDEERAKTVEMVEVLKKLLPSGTKDEILNQIDAVNEFTRPFAERVMDVAIATAMKGKSIE
ncbi:chaperone protein HscA [compost metagenome]